MRIPKRGQQPLERASFGRSLTWTVRLRAIVLQQSGYVICRRTEAEPPSSLHLRKMPREPHAVVPGSFVSVTAGRRL